MEISFGKRKAYCVGSHGKTEATGIKVEHLVSRNVIRLQSILKVDTGTYDLSAVVTIPDSPDLLEAVAAELLAIAKKQKGVL